MHAPVLLPLDRWMINEDLNKRFHNAVNFVNDYTDPLPADLLLKLYAYFKIANKNFDNPKSRTPLINAFKANALFQAKRISIEEAMEKYVELVDKELKDL